MDNSNHPNLRSIGFLIPEFPGQTHIAWWRVANELRALGIDVRIISTQRPKSTTSVHKLLEAEVDQALYVWPPKPILVFAALLRHPLGAVKGLTYIAGLKKSDLVTKIRLLPIFVSALFLSSALRAEDINYVFVHSCANAAHLIAMCNRISGVRYALRLGGDPDVYGSDHYSKMERADFILSASPTYLDQLVDVHNVDRSKLFWSWVGTDLSSYSVSPSWPHNRSPFALRIATVARLNMAKGHMFALNAVRELISSGEKVIYTIIGAGPFRGEIEAFLARHSLEECVYLVGAKDAQEISDILRDTDVFVMPSFGIGEAAPAAICEAMAAGVPVIASRIGAVPFMIKDGIDGFLVEQCDSTAIRDRLLQLATDNERLSIMKGKAKVSSAQFDVKLTAERILDLFRQASVKRRKTY